MVDYFCNSMVSDVWAVVVIIQVKSVVSLVQIKKHFGIQQIRRFDSDFLHDHAGLKPQGHISLRAVNQWEVQNIHGVGHEESIQNRSHD